MHAAARAGKTIEVRRSEAGSARGRAPDQADLERLWLTAVPDRQRPRIALPPLPAPVPPPPPPSKCALKTLCTAVTGPQKNAFFDTLPVQKNWNNTNAPSVNQKPRKLAAAWVAACAYQGSSCPENQLLLKSLSA
jgi:hypothetical protein